MLAKQRRCRRDNNALDEEEEIWFDKDDEEGDGGAGDITPPFRPSPEPEDTDVEADPFRSVCALAKKLREGKQ